MSQSRTHSAAEAVANVAIGYGISVGATVLILPAFGYRVTAPDAFGIAGVFTLVSLARSYLLRRAFNRFGGRHG
tara:strand:+ start:1358 stop:1579 length:222 start_codon:yes stop_codon:yes gene_type:complete